MMMCEDGTRSVYKRTQVWQVLYAIFPLGYILRFIKDPFFAVRFGNADRKQNRNRRKEPDRNEIPASRKAHGEAVRERRLTGLYQRFGTRLR